jgi:hypothetical protein
MFFDRRVAAVPTALIVTVYAGAWDWRGWDRASVAGAASFALATFGWIVAVHVTLALAHVPILNAPAIASERDRKSLDSLLATRLTRARSPNSPRSGSTAGRVLESSWPRG